MTAKKKASSGKKLKLKKETIKDLNVKGKASKIKGGRPVADTGQSACPCPSQYCKWIEP